MEIRAKINLTLPSTINRITLKYDTFEKATYDSYLMTALVINADSKTDAYSYIDEITGNGSLNVHFKKLYDEISLLTDEQRKGIIQNSLYPVTIINQNNSYRYYSTFNISKMNGRIFKKDLKENENELKDFIMPKQGNIKFLSLEVSKPSEEYEHEIYDAIFSDESIKIEITKGDYVEINQDTFNEIYTNDVVSLGDYLGNVGAKITDGNWNVLTQSIVKNLSKDDKSFCDSLNRHCSLIDDYIRAREIIKVFELYFYKDTKYAFIPANSKLCLETVKYLLKSGKVNEVRTKIIIDLLNAASNDMITQEVTQYILSKKESKEMCELALAIIKKGIVDNWDEDVLRRIKNSISNQDFNYIYRINQNLDFSDEDILYIDDDILNKDDKKRKNLFVSENRNKIELINKMVGEITTEGIREKIKPLENSPLKKRVKKYCNDSVGHETGLGLDPYNSEKINRIFNRVKSFYDTDFIEIKKVIKDYENKKN